MVNGILNIYKEKGYTSHDVVARLRGIVGQRKIGHTGTLDPDAEGVLPVCLGRATKVCELLTDKDKTYETVMLLGCTTDTQDISGEILEEKDTASLSEEQVTDCIQEYIGEYNQIPPMYSAIKINGKKLYELAREGKTVERKARKVTILNIRILEIKLPRVRMEVNCSKGTYIRTLCHDIGQTLGCGACMESLLRTKVGRFTVGESVKLDEIQEYVKEGRLNEKLISLDDVFMDRREVTVKAAQKQLAYNGNALPLKGVEPKNGFENGEQVRIYDEERRFIGIYVYEESKKRLKPEKMFLDQEELKK